MNKAKPGNFFEDFHLGQELRHATPRTVTSGDQALYIALYGSRFPIHCSDAFARQVGLPRAPIDDLLAFNIIFGKTVPDVSLNAIANLGYAQCVFGALVYPGDTVTAISRVIGLKETSNRKAGVVYVRSTGSNQEGATVLEYVRWVMVRKRDANSPAPEPFAPDLSSAVAAEDLAVPEGLDLRSYDTTLAGSPYLWDDYEVGECIDHLDGVTIEETEHQMATRLYQNTARVHFNQQLESQGRFGRRIVYGGHAISLARALSYNGLGNAVRIAAINGGRHVAPVFAGDTVYAWSAVIDKMAVTARCDLGAIRVRTIATRDQACTGFPGQRGDGEYDPAVALDLDYTVLLPRRSG